MGTETKKNESAKTARPPIVVVMGHIDHGKTTILDWYRKAKVVESESGGITQHIGAYEFEHRDKKITFIDTPGHEAFSKMRSRGAKIADVAVLVIAGDESVKPQTKEALQIIKTNDLPFVVAMNKSDKPEFNAEKIKQELAREDILVESYGGKIPFVEISAKTGQNMDALLETILLLAEIEELSADSNAPAEGVVIEAHMDRQRGITATILVREGTIKKGDVTVMGRSIENIKILENFHGKSINDAGPSSPVVAIGLANLPAVGDQFKVFADKSAAEEFLNSLPPIEMKTRTQINKNGASPEEIGKPVFNMIIKADVAGSAEVLEEAVKKLASQEIGINVLKSDVGNINESDVKLAMATKLVSIVGFKVKIDPAVKELADNAKTHIITGDVIYKILDEVKENLADLLPPVISVIGVGRAKVLKIFKKDGNKQILGGRVEEGRMEKGALAEIKRAGSVVGRGKINQLQKDRVNADEIQKGFEFGMMLESEADAREGDILEAFFEEISKRKL